MSAEDLKKKTTFVVVPHSHWDREWYLPFEAFRHRLVKMLDKVMDLIEAGKGFKSFHLDGQAIPLLDYEEAVGRSERLRRHIEEGRILAGPWYILPDEFLVSGESIIRNISRGMKAVQEYGGRPVKVGYLPDMFGHIAQMPAILKGFGLDTAIMWRGITSDITGDRFRWQALDGSEVFTLHLPEGYGAAANLPEDPQLMKERLKELSEQAGEDGRVLLLYGADHVEPASYIISAMDKAVDKVDFWSWEFGDVESWMKSISGKRPESSHRGELRSAHSTLILPSVASARMYLKLKDFDADTSLTRYAEPISAISRSMGGPDRAAMLDYAWELLLQNHPHDSICGCSVDEVHDEMETRYRKISQVADRVIKESASVAWRHLSGEGPRLLVFGPGTGAGGPLVGELEGRLRSTLAVKVGDEERPLQVLSTETREATLMETVLPRKAGIALLSELAGRELFGLYLQDVKISIKGGRLRVRIDAGSSPSLADINSVRKSLEEAAVDDRVREVEVKVSRLPRHRVASTVRSRPGVFIESYRLVRQKSPRKEDGVMTGADYMENGFVRVQFEPGGTCLLTDKRTGIGYRCMRFLDVADKGDTYNFDPLPGDKPVCEPEKVSLKNVSEGPAASVFEVRHRFRIPKQLHAGRKSRIRKMVSLDITTRLTLYRDCPRVDFVSSLTNPAMDHRLQTAIRIPFETDSMTVETAFGMVERKVRNMGPPDTSGQKDNAAMLLGVEGTYSTSPQKTVSLVRNDDGAGVAFLNRGIAEVDAIPLVDATRLSMTLVRSVGWLSRGDLAMRTGDAGPMMATPGAQCLRPFTFEYAVLPFGPGSTDADILAEAHQFAWPPMLGMAHSPGGGKKRQDCLFVDNERIRISSLLPLDNGEVEARLVNYGSGEERCSLSWSGLWSGVRMVDLSGKALGGPSKISPDRAELVFSPHGIITLRFTETSKT